MKIKAVGSVFAVIIVVFVLGCSSKEQQHSGDRWDLVAGKDGIVYRINKHSGEVDLIAGKSSVIIQGTENVSSKTNHIVDWGKISMSDLGDIKVQLKTNWRDGNFYYIFKASPFDHFQSIIKTAKSDAQFFVSFYDDDGFLISTLSIKVGEMQISPFSGSKPDTFELNATSTCSFDIYASLKSWSISRIGF